MKMGEIFELKVNWNKTFSFWRNYGWIIFLVCFWIFYGLIIVHEAYLNNIYVSSDSVGYLKAAQAVRHGFGFNAEGLSGGTSWFASWPMGYPVLIAVFMFLLPGHSSYLASKALAVCLAGLMLCVFGKRYKKDSWIFALLLLNPGLMIDYNYTWSEVPFIPFLLLFTGEVVVLLTHDTVRKYHYVLLTLFTVGAFSVRYFGLFALLYLAVFWAVMLAVWIKKYNRNNEGLKSKLIGLAAAGGVSAVCEGGYLYLNKKMNGHATGVDRLIFQDDMKQLTDNLYDALRTEVAYAFQNSEHSLFKYINSTTFSQRILAFAVFAGLIMLLLKRKKLDEAFGFISVGLFYYIVFICVRYHSSMDAFSYRFFAPASFLILIGIVLCAREWLADKGYTLMPVMTGIFFLVVLSSLSLYSLDSVRTDSAYGTFNAAISEAFAGCPSRSLVLNIDFDDYRWPVIRPDLAVSSLEEGETKDQLLERAAPYDYICIKKNVITDAIVPNEAYTKDVRDWLQNEMDKSSEGAYVIIPLKQQTDISALTR